jgi:large subunit ribosomal protein L18
MADKRIKRKEYRRKREGKTNYKQRLTYLVSRKPRFVIRKTNNYIIVQLVEYKPTGDVIICSVSSSALEKYGFSFSKKSIPAAYLTGLLAGKIALSKKSNKAIIDLGMHSKSLGNTLFSVVKGLVDSGVDVPYSDKCFPPEDRITGKHIVLLNDVVSKDKDKFKNVFVGYEKKKINAKDLPSFFEKTKEKIMKL